MGLSVAAILLAVVLVVGLLAWVRRDLRARRAPMRAWWLVVGCYALAAIAWLVALTIPLPVAVAWLATIPAAVATVIPERLAAWLGGLRRPLHRPRPTTGLRPATRTPGAHRMMAHPTGAARPSQGVTRRRPRTPWVSIAHLEPAPMLEAEPAPMLETETAPMPEAETARMDAPGPAAILPPGPRAIPPPSSEPVATAAPPPRQRHAPGFGRRHWAPGDLRLAVELLEDAARIPDLDEAARDRIEARLGRLERFHGSATAELLTLVRDDVHARLAAEVPTIDPDPARARRIAALLDELDPRPAGGSG